MIRHPSRLIVLGAWFLAALISRAAAVTIGVAGDKFTFDGKPRFLLGVSYFDARNWHASDLDEIHRLGYDSIRIWIDWADQGFFDSAGNWRAKQTLLDFLAAANARELAVDVTVLNSDPHTRDSFGVPQRPKVVRSVFSALKGAPNAFYDMMNEHDHNGTPASHAELKDLIAIAHLANPKALITVSSNEDHLVGNDEKLRTDNIDGELDAGVAMLTPHLRRTPNWDEMTGIRVKLLKDYLQQVGRVMPVYLNEEARRGYRDFYPSAERLLHAAQAARDAGAAGYNFHTGACFNLRSGTLFDQLDPEEKKAIAALPRLMFQPPSPGAP
jgi:hypothetical protein